MTNQQGDVLLYQSQDFGEIEVIDGLVTMSGGLDTAVYISLFGGNYNDDGLLDSKYQWWGNYSETALNRIRSETQSILIGLPATTGNLLKLEEAIRRDTSWLLEERIASSIDISASILTLNKVRIILNINAYSEDIELEYTKNWDASL
jgi:phage gp46-like protein